MKDYYKILGVNKEASQKDIKGAYRKLALKYHPDHNKDKESSNKFNDIKEAYDVLSDNNKKNKYDNLKNHRFNRNANFKGSWGGFDINDIYEDLKGTGFTENFDYTFGQNWESKIKGRDYNIEMKITVEDAFYGTKKSIDLVDPELDENTIEIKIKPGTYNGQKLRIRGRGWLHPLNSQAPRGDIIIKIIIISHPKYELKDRFDLIQKIDVTHLDCILGNNINIDSLHGKIKFKIPETTSSNRIFRLKGKGMPRMNNDSQSYGDLYIKLNLKLPEKLSKKERELYDKLNEIIDERIHS